MQTYITSPDILSNARLVFNFMVQGMDCLSELIEQTIIYGPKESVFGCVNLP